MAQPKVPYQTGHAIRAADHARDYLWAASAPRIPASKQVMADKARACLQRLADAAGFQVFTTRFNAGGPAVSGEVYLSAPGLHAWIEVSCVLGPVLTYRWRRTTTYLHADQRPVGTEDGPNVQVPIADLTDAAEAQAVATRMAVTAARGLDRSA